jgi:hypothetical protein
LQSQAANKRVKLVAGMEGVPAGVFAQTGFFRYWPFTPFIAVRFM